MDEIDSQQQKKRVLILTNHSYMLYRFRRELIEKLMKTCDVSLRMPYRGHEEDFIAMGLDCQETDFERRGMNPVKDIRLFQTYWNILKQVKPDMVITYSIKPNVYGGMACALAGIPYCVNVQGLGTAFQKPGICQLVTVMYRMAVQKAKVVFFENEGNAQTFLERHILKPEKIRVLSGAGINLEEYPLVPYPDNDRFHFLYLGRIMKEKGVKELGTAMRRLHNKLGNRVVLDVVGFCEEDMREWIEEMVAAGSMIFHDFQSNPNPYYEQTDCVVLPSYHEGMSNVLLEAAATGRPVITSDIHGCQEAVDPGKTGLLCQVGDADSLYEQMLHMTELSRKERERMGLAARKKMEHEFDKKLVIEKTIEAIFS